jgi:hypothetical protein
MSCNAYTWSQFGYVAPRASTDLRKIAYIEINHISMRR